jgi:NAD(P)H-dependent FMN reductase
VLSKSGHKVANFVPDTINSHKASTSITLQPQTTLDPVDIATHNLSIFNEPGVANQIKSPQEYKHEHTRVETRHIAAFDAFVFVSAQLNWGIYAELKNPIDYLFHEYDKPATIISYGGHGGQQCAEQLKNLLGSIGMHAIEKMANMSFPSPEFCVKAFRGKDLGLDANNNANHCAEHKSEIAAA